MNTLTVDTGAQVAITRRITSVMLKSHGGVDVKWDETLSIPDQREDLPEDEREDIEMHSDAKKDIKSLPHPDFTQAMELLRAHYAILANQLGNRDSDLATLDDDPEFLKLFRVEGIKIAHGTSGDSCTMKGTSATSYGTLSIETAKVSFSGPYKWYEEFSHVVEHVCHEALLYMDGKIAPTSQLDLFDEEGNEID